MNELFDRYKPLAYKIANRFARTRAHCSDEIEAAALEGLWKASEKESVSEDGFKSLAGMVIKNTILNELKKQNPVSTHLYNKIKSGNNSYYKKEGKELILPTHISIDYTPETDKGYESKLDNEINNKLGLVDSGESIFIKREREKAVNEALKLLPERERATLTGLFFEDKDMKEVSKENGCSYQNIQKIRNKALLSLKDKLSN